MSEFFYPSNISDPWDTLIEMSNGRAKIFIELTHVAAQFYEVATPVIVRNNDPDVDMYCIDAERFCLLLEKVFSHSLNLFYVWAGYGARIYEIIKAEKFL